MAASIFQWIRGIISFVYMMCYTMLCVSFAITALSRACLTLCSLMIVLGKPTNKYMEKDKPVFVSKTFRELWKWDFSVIMGRGKLRPGMPVPNSLQTFSLSSGSTQNLCEYFDSLYAPSARCFTPSQLTCVCCFPLLQPVRTMSLSLVSVQSLDHRIAVRWTIGSSLRRILRPRRTLSSATNPRRTLLIAGTSRHDTLRPPPRRAHSDRRSL